MKLNLKNCAAITAALLLSTQTTLAGEVNVSGTACWTGSSDMLATSKKDWGMNWQLTGTYVDDTNAAENSFYRCVGHGKMIGGEFQGHSWNCINYFEDGSTLLSSGKSRPDGGAEAKYVSGTGRHEGVTGSYSGEPMTRVGKPPQGQFAACRMLEGTKILKDPA